MSDVKLPTVEERLALVERKVDFIMTFFNVNFPSRIAGMPPRTITLLEHFIEVEHRKMMEQPRIQL